MSITLEEIVPIISRSFDGLTVYISKFQRKSGLLKVTTQDNIRGKMDELYAPFSSWMSSLLMSLTPEDTLKSIDEKMVKATKQFGAQTQFAIGKSIESFTERLANMGRFRVHSKVSNTFYTCSRDAIEQGKEPVIELAAKILGNEKTSKTPKEQQAAEM